MRTVRAVRKLLVAFVTVAMLAFVLPAIAASAYLPGAAYPWVQPGAVTVGVSNAWVQPPARISISPAPVATKTAVSLLDTTYPWVQPPAEIPAG